MSPAEMLAAMALALFALGFTVYTTFAGWAKLKRIDLEHQRGSSPPITGELLQRLERIEQIVETTAIEVERVTEAQRWIARQMADPPRIPSARPAGKADTPH
jgi:hypothetical protein